ncbi:MAG: hypothetical protein V4684_04795 [Pseudomonadota bacterium]
MGPVEFLLHLIAFAAPAAVVGLLVALAARVLIPRSASLAWWRHAAINTAAGLAALGLGLGYFGVDGKMATYAALVLAVASAQWLAGRGWKG